jgi:glycosyltransferase involved in cell wall biosynthesis
MKGDTSLRVPRKVFIWSVQDSHTTAQYFRRVIEKKGIEVAYGGPNELSEIQSDDLVFLIDTAPQKWFKHYHLLPCPAFAYLIDSHLDIKYRSLLAPFFDEVFIAQQEDVSKFSSVTNATWLPLACDEDLFQGECEKKWEVGFVGQWGNPSSARYQTLKTISKLFRMNPQDRFYTPSEMSDVYRSSSIVINHSVKGDLNMRVFEAMASGALLVTDRIGNGLEDIFEGGLDMVIYDSEQEAVEKIRFFLNHPQEANRIRKEGRKKVLEFHTYAKRWDQVLEKWRLSGNCLQAPVRGISKSERHHWMGKVAAAHGDPSTWWENFKKVPWKWDLLFEGARCIRRYAHHQRYLRAKNGP